MGLILICEAVSCKVLHAITESLPVQKSVESAPFVKKNGCDYMGFDEDMGFNLSSSLEKLCTWEKKLYNEVKVCNFSTCNCLPNTICESLIWSFDSALFCG